MQVPAGLASTQLFARHLILHQTLLHTRTTTETRRHMRQALLIERSLISTQKIHVGYNLSKKGILKRTKTNQPHSTLRHHLD